MFDQTQSCKNDKNKIKNNNFDKIDFKNKTKFDSLLAINPILYANYFSNFSQSNNKDGKIILFSFKCFSKITT